MHRDVSHSAQKRKPGIGLFPGTGCPGCAWILRLLYWTGNARQDRARHWYSGGGCGDMGPLRLAASGVAAGGSLVLDLASGLLRLSRCSPLCRFPAHPGCGIHAGLCSQSRPDLRVGAVTRASLYMR